MGEPLVTAESAAAHLDRKFGSALEPAREYMRALARSHTPTELALKPFGRHEKLRPRIPEGVTGWGAMGVVDLAPMRKMAVAT